jgi:hypothetical protein
MIKWFFLIPFFELFIPKNYFPFLKNQVKPHPFPRETKRLTRIKIRKMKKN